jgi:SAM-dependent methyltransferase
MAPAKASSPYGPDLAQIHDEAFGDWARAAANVLLAHAPPGLVVDLGCGSGILAQELTRAGRPVLGIDLSPAMLKLAKARAPKATFRKGSLLDAELPPCSAVAIVGEGVNYLFDGRDHERRLRALFRRAYAALAPGGILLFDAAGPGRASRAGNRSWHEGKGWAVLTESIEAAGKLTRRIVTFRRDGAAAKANWRRRAETHELRLLGPRGLTKALQSAGFTVQRLDGYGVLRLPKGHAAFIARKPSS